MVAIKVLYVNGGIMNRGGIESFMMNYFRHIDRNRVQIDFVVHGYERGAYDDEIESRGGIIYHVPIKSKHPFTYKREIRKIFLSGNYKIIHSHVDAMSCWILQIAKNCGIPVRIAHSHNTSHLSNNKIKFFINEIARKNICKYSNYCFACSEAAGRWLFGKNQYTVIPNAIDIHNYLYDEDKRNTLRQKLNINSDEVVFGHVGRFDTQKNHEFLMKVFCKISLNKEKIKLILVGDGWKKEYIEKMVIEYNLNDRVIFLGNQTNVNELYNVMDYFVFPSLFEGLSVVLVEAQINGLTCYTSDVISLEHNISGNVCFLPLQEDKWVDVLNDLNKPIRNNCIDKVRIAGYDIILAAKNLEDFYVNVGKCLK